MDLEKLADPETLPRRDRFLVEWDALDDERRMSLIRVHDIVREIVTLQIRVGEIQRVIDDLDD